jgi:hypothetical protein
MAQVTTSAPDRCVAEQRMAAMPQQGLGFRPVMADPTAFTDPENWTGSFYELSLELGQRSDEHLDRVLRLLWREAGIVGCYGERDQDPADQVTLPASAASLQRFGHLYGCVAPPDRAPTVAACSAMNFRESDWLTLGLPLGALARTDPRIGGFPFDPDGGPSSLAWRAGLDTWLAKVAVGIFGQVQFQLGLIGFDLAADVGAADLQGVVPDRRFAGYLVPDDDRLRYLPANR